MFVLTFIGVLLSFGLCLAFQVAVTNLSNASSVPKVTPSSFATASAFPIETTGHNDDRLLGEHSSIPENLTLRLRDLAFMLESVRNRRLVYSSSDKQ
jgi:hypothetical protein